MNGVNSAGRLMPGAPGVDWVRELQIYPMAERCTGATRLADLEMHARRRAGGMRTAAFTPLTHLDQQYY